ncbi:MAG: glycerophosphodiester phosphodiesterase family protein [Candidatus Pacebacteria bacterium]|nr:glycerophosphodiester phosphodiesterase family protein [Candidatus Paceibacterota bacterium]
MEKTNCNIISHRGLCKTTPDGDRKGENTIEAYDLGLKKLKSLGYPPAIEFDVRQTKDGVPVIMHDETIDRTTNGSGRVMDFTVPELKKFDAGYGRKIPLLSEVFAAFKNTGVIFHVELEENGLVEIVKQTILNENVQNQVIVSAFDGDDAGPLYKHTEYFVSWDDLFEIGKYFPIALLTTEKKIQRLGGVDKYIETAVEAGAIAIVPQDISVTKELVTKAHKSKLIVNTWTVNDPKVFIKLERMGVDGVFCDNPSFLCF